MIDLDRMEIVAEAVMNRDEPLKGGFELINIAGDVLSLIAEVRRLRADLAEAVEVLEPFASFGAREVDEEGWAYPPMRERIVDWMGPTDFRRATSIVSKHGGKANG